MEKGMEITSITNGIIIDHIHAGLGLKILEHLDIDKGLGSVALIMNVHSEKYGKKDLIKLENTESVDINILGLIDHQATVNYIKDGKKIKKTKAQLPQKVTNLIKCKNPRCITSTENVPDIFHFTGATEKYRCEYCDNVVKFFD